MHLAFIADVNAAELPRAAERGLRYLGDGSVAWQIAVGNGRVIARSAGSFDNASSAFEALDDVLTGADLGAATVGHALGSAGWVWTISDRAGRPVATSSRSYDRRGSARRSLDRFLGALPQQMQMD